MHCWKGSAGAPRVRNGAAGRPPRAWALGYVRRHVHTAVARSSGRTGPCSQQPMRPPHRSRAPPCTGRPPEWSALAAWTQKRGRGGAPVPAQGRRARCLWPPRHTAQLSSVVPMDAPASVVRFAPAANLLCLSGGGRMWNVPTWARHGSPALPPGPAAVGCWLWAALHTMVHIPGRTLEDPVLRRCGRTTRLRRRRGVVRRAAGGQADRDRDALPACQKRPSG